MELLQKIEKLINGEQNCPYTAGRCELFFNSESTRSLLRLSLIPVVEDPEKTFVDICCYDEQGFMLSMLNDVPYISGGMLIELPSLMTAYVEIAVRRVVFKDGAEWSSDIEFPKVITLSESSAERVEVSDNELSFDATARISLADMEALKNNIPNDEPENADLENEDEYEDEDEDEYEDGYEDEDEHDDFGGFASEEELIEFIKKDPTERRKRRIKRLIALVVIVVFLFGGFMYFKYTNEANTAYKTAMNLYNSGKFEDAIGRFDDAEKYIFFGDKKKELIWCKAMTYSQLRDFKNAAAYFRKLDGYKESTANLRSIVNAYSGVVAAGKSHSVALKNDGTVLYAGLNDHKQCDVSTWKDVIFVSAGGNHTVAIKRDNTVLATGDNSKNQCNVERWSNISSVSAGYEHTVGAEKIGKVTACGDNTCGQCNVGDWSGVVSVSAGAYHTVGLCVDGTVLAVGDNSNGECNVGKWSDVIEVVAGDGFTAGLTKDGKILFTGNDSKKISDAKKSKDVFSISAGSYNLLVTDYSGKTTAYGGNESNQSVTDLWTDITSTCGGERHSIGITKNGTAVAAGANDKNQAALSEWKDIGLPKQVVSIRRGE